MGDSNYKETIKLLSKIMTEREIDMDISESLKQDEDFINLYSSLSELRKALLSLGAGDLNCPIQGKGYILGTLKNLQAALRHLTWQTKSIASGDFTQKVDFMGEFSESFNSMTHALNKAIKDLKKSEEEYRLLFENAVESIVVVKDLKFQLSNPMFQKLTGYTTEELQSMHVSELIYPEDFSEVVEMHKNRMMHEEHHFPMVSRIVCKDKTTKWVESNGIQINWNGEKAILNFVIDITDRKTTEDALRKSEAKYRLLTENASDVIWVLNMSDGKFTYISPPIYYLRGMTVEEARQETFEDSMLPESYEKIQRVIPERMEAFLKEPNSNRYYINEIQQYRKDGSVVWVEVSTKFRISSAGEIEVVGVSRNIDKRKKTEQQVLYLSYHDQLTGLYNRRYYEEELARMDNEGNLPISLVMADVNGLKLTNDAFGHLVGDELLKCVSDIFKSNAREGDVIARIGGDEFVLLLPKTDEEQAKKIIARIRDYITKTDSDKIIISVSFGHGTKKHPHESFENIFMQAENHMYQKKLLDSRSMKSETIKLINASLYARDGREQQHSQRVSKLCIEMGKAMGLGADMVDELGLLGLFHDIGKIGVNEKILNKAEKLNPLEWEELKRHSEIGYQILRSINEFAIIADYVLAHHERIDGKGYPRKLTGNQIPLQSKILSVADAYDSMTNNYSYKRGMTKKQAIEELLNNKNTQFDEEIVDLFIRKILS